MLHIGTFHWLVLFNHRATFCQSQMSHHTVCCLWIFKSWDHVKNIYHTFAFLLFWKLDHLLFFLRVKKVDFFSFQKCKSPVKNFHMVSTVEETFTYCLDCPKQPKQPKTSKPFWKLGHSTLCPKFQSSDSFDFGIFVFALLTRVSLWGTINKDK